MHRSAGCLAPKELPWYVIILHLNNFSQKYHGGVYLEFPNVKLPNDKLSNVKLHVECHIVEMLSWRHNLPFDILPLSTHCLHR
jgi:hypothetical protein